MIDGHLLVLSKANPIRLLIFDETGTHIRLEHLQAYWKSTAFGVCDEVSILCPGTSSESLFLAWFIIEQDRETHTEQAKGPLSPYQ